MKPRRPIFENEMWLMKKDRTASAIPKRLLEMTNQSKPPFDPLEVARHLLADVHQEPLSSGTYSRIKRRKDGYEITIDKSLDVKTGRWALARALGIVVMEKIEDAPIEDTAARRKRDIYDPDERALNGFAAELLVPRKWMIEAIQAGIDKLDDLAAMFGLHKDLLEEIVLNRGIRVYDKDLIQQERPSEPSL